MATPAEPPTAAAPPPPPPPPSSVTSQQLQQQAEAERVLKVNALKAKEKLNSHIVPPSHILSNGKFIYLPPPSDDDYANFFERSVAKFALISADGATDKDKDDKKDDKKEEEDEQPKIHPLALASARIQGNGISELSKAINLSSLVGQNEYFGLSNIVTASAELEAAASATTTTTAATTTNTTTDSKDGTKQETKETKQKEQADTNTTTTTITTKNNKLDEEQNAIIEEQKLRATYTTRSKHRQFTNASTVLHRHAKRLTASIVTQRLLDQRLLSLRKKWRLVAPEHGTRTVGPTRPTETVAVDVEVYDRDRTGGGSGAVVGNSSGSSSTLGRIARMVPRYATIELGEGYNVKHDVKTLWKSASSGSSRSSHATKRKHEVMMEGDTNTNTTNTTSQEEKRVKIETSSNGDGTYTRAEPFAVADPTLGKVDENFDPDKVPMLTLLLQIEKSSSGYVKSVTLSSTPLSSSSEKKKDDSNQKENSKSIMKADEKVVLALQHSLFCASLFESIRKEISSSSSSDEQQQQYSNKLKQQQQQQHASSIVWLSSEMEDTFLPPPSLMAGGGGRREEDTMVVDYLRGGGGGGLVGGAGYEEEKEEEEEEDVGTASLCVVHCHEGEVKVQLDSEYALTIKLVEAGTASAAAAAAENDSTADNNNTSTMEMSSSAASGGDSGSQSPQRLGVLCRALLLRAQFVYHEHCMKTRAGLTKTAAATSTTLTGGGVGVGSRQPVPVVRSPRILQSCVGLGSKMLLERKVRSTLKHLSQWLQNDLKTSDKLQVEWVPYTLFDSHSQFALSVGNKFCMDVIIDGDGLHITTLGAAAAGEGDFRSVKFGSAVEFELFVKFEMKRRLLLEGN